MILLAIVAFFVIFSLLILIHEFGHFFAAKRAGVKVEEFGFGMPPKIWGVKKGETLYSINLIPFGGFVRMLGEMDGGVKAKMSKRSFERQPIRTQLWIVCAGVVMNLLLAFILLTFGFMIGIEPLIASEEEFYDGIQEGLINVEVTEVAENEEAYYLPRLVYLEEEGSVFADYLQDGDVIVQVDGVEVLLEEDLYDSFGNKFELDLTVYRDGEGELLFEDLPMPVSHPVVSYVEPESPAEEYGLLLGDQVLSVDGEEVFDANQITDITSGLDEDDTDLDYQILRDGEILDLNIPLREDGRVGIGISNMLPYYGLLSLYTSYLPHDMLGFEKVSYGVYSPVIAVKEMARLGKLTAFMFIDVFGNFLTANDVPAGVAGPVGIAQMTFVNIQNGFAAMLRFVALLSLSLGVINILPIPALDGGRAVFILYHGITGRRPNPKIEQWIHTAGFFLLLLFLAYITFNDILSFF